MKEDERFVDTGKFLSAFADEVWVRCASCNTAGVVTAHWIPYEWVANFDCRHCRLSLASEKKDWLGAMRWTGRQPCGHCGHKWVGRSIDFDAPPKNPPDELPAKCPECDHQTMVKLTSNSLVREGLACDPHFGLPLQLTTDTKHGVVWAYNMKHVAELSAYVKAKLRIRQNSAHRALLSRLPKWMKLAKHRDEIAKALDKIAT